MAHALRSYGLLLRWNLLRLRAVLPLLLILQTLLAVGVVVGFSFLVPQPDPTTVRYLSTGAMTLTLVTVGMVAAPQLVARQKIDGMFDFQRALPVPRLAVLAAEGTVWVALALPGLAASLGVTALRFGVTFQVSPLVLPATLLVAVCAVAIGYGIAYATGPEVAGAVTQLVFFVALMFAPITYPAERLPDWLATVHTWLPFVPMAQVIRETVDVPPTGVSVQPFLVLTLWCVAGLATTHRVMARRA